VTEEGQPQDPGSDNEPGAPSVSLYLLEQSGSDIASAILMAAIMDVPSPGHPTEENRDFSLRRPTHSQERMRKKKSACSVRNDGWGWTCALDEQNGVSIHSETRRDPGELRNGIVTVRDDGVE